MGGGVEIDLAGSIGTANGQCATGAGGDGVFVGVIKINPADSAITIKSDGARRGDRPEKIGKRSRTIGNAAIPIRRIGPASVGILDPLRKWPVQRASCDDVAGEAEGAVVGLFGAEGVAGTDGKRQGFNSIGNND